MTVRIRVRPCLDVANGRVVKGVNFVNLRDAGDPVEAARAYDAARNRLLDRVHDRIRNTFAVLPGAAESGAVRLADVTPAGAAGFAATPPAKAA